jgi:hypothetical protein
MFNKTFQSERGASMKPHDAETRKSTPISTKVLQMQDRTSTYTKVLDCKTMLIDSEVKSFELSRKSVLFAVRCIALCVPLFFFPSCTLALGLSCCVTRGYLHITEQAVIAPKPNSLTPFNLKPISKDIQQQRYKIFSWYR